MRSDAVGDGLGLAEENVAGNFVDGRVLCSHFMWWGRREALCGCQAVATAPSGVRPHESATTAFRPLDLSITGA